MGFAHIVIQSGPHGRTARVEKDGADISPLLRGFEAVISADVKDATRITLNGYAFMDFDGEAELEWRVRMKDGSDTVIAEARGESRGDALRRLAEHFDDLDAVSESVTPLEALTGLRRDGAELNGGDGA